MMKKWILAVFALGMIGVVYAAGELMQLQEAVKVGNKTYTVGTQGTQMQDVTFRDPITVNGTTYPAGTKFTVLKTASGELVPITANTGLAASGAAVGGLASATTATVVTIAAVIAVVANNNKTTVSATVTQ